MSARSTIILNKCHAKIVKIFRKFYYFKEMTCQMPKNYPKVHTQFSWYFFKLIELSENFDNFGMSFI